MPGAGTEPSQLHSLTHSRGGRAGKSGAGSTPDTASTPAPTTSNDPLPAPTYVYHKMETTSITDPSYRYTPSDYRESEDAGVYFYDSSSRRPDMPPPPSAPTSISYATSMAKKKKMKQEPVHRIEISQPMYTYQAPGSSVRDPSYR